MATQIIAALRHQKQLRGNTFIIAQELAHRMNSAGYGRVAYHYLAWKAHCCRRTAINQIAKLTDPALKLFRKTVIRTKNGNAWNLYQYIGPRVHTAFPPITTRGAKGASTLPEDKQNQGCLRREEREKDEGFQEEIQRRETWLYTRSGLEPGSFVYEIELEKITELKARLSQAEASEQ